MDFGDGSAQDMEMSCGPRWERRGDRIHHPPGGNPDFVRGLLRYLEEEGFDGAPRFLGVDERGRDVLSFIDGFVAPDLDVGRWRLEQIEAAFALLRRFHEVTAGSVLAGTAEVVCHNDFTPQNVVFRDGAPLVDLDLARHLRRAGTILAASTDDLIDEMIPEEGRAPFRLSREERLQLVRAAALAEQAMGALDIRIDEEDLEDAPRPRRTSAARGVKLTSWRLRFS